MKFVKTKAIAALSITLLLSTQAKGMGHDIELAAQIPMAQLPVEEVVKSSLANQARDTFSKAASAAVDFSKSAYGVAQGAGSYLVKAGTEAGTSVAQVVASHTPELVKEYPGAALIAGGLAAYGAYKAYEPAKNGAKKAAQLATQAVVNTTQTVVNNAGKIAVVGSVAGVAGLVAYHNQDAIVNFAKDAVSAVSNVEYAKYGNAAVETVKPAGQFAVKQVAKLKINGARLVEAARNMDVSAMAKDAREYIVNHKAVIGGSAAVAGAVATGVVANKVVKARKAAHVKGNLVKAAANVQPKVMVPMTEVGAELKAAATLKPYRITPAQLSARAVSKPAPAKARQA